MRKIGWGISLLLMGLALAAVAVPANAGYVLSMSGPLTASAGTTVNVSAVLTAGGAGGTLHDFMNWDVGFAKSAGAPTLGYQAYSLDSIAYATGGPSDFSLPKMPIPAGTLAPPAHIEATTRLGQKFGLGTVTTLAFTIPATALTGQTYDFQPRPDTFADGPTIIPTTAGSTLRITVTPEPATLMLLGLGGLAVARRRFVGA